MKTAYERLDSYNSYFGISQLMLILDRSESTIRRLIKNKRIPCYNTSNIYYFKKESIQEYLIEEGL